MLYAEVVKRPVFVVHFPVAVRAVALVAVTGSFAAIGCKKTPEPTSKAGPSLLGSAPAAPRSAAPATVAQAPVEISWVDPPGWTRSARPSPMRKATYVIPHAPGDKDDAELGVFYFGPGGGGGIDANVDRWVKQFSDVTLDKVKRADRSANGLVEHTVEIDSGTFNANSMGQGQARLKTGYALLGAIVESPGGMYFFKLTGPEKTVAVARAPFYALLDSVNVKH
jgi:hypothetical protein